MWKYFLFIFFVGALTSPIKKNSGLHKISSCMSCHPVDPNKINVHLIPHSHDDVGWLKTVDQYFFGYRNDIQRAGVQYIISSTVEALKANPNRRFVQVETAFFWKWWQRQTDATKQDFINLVNNGQLEIINAAWSMNDEAVVNYQSTIDQFTWGLRTINDTIGKCGVPRIGWQIDPFGHSREQASIFAQLGYDGVFFARLDYNDKDQRIVDKNMEVIWKGSANLDNTNLFTNIFPEFYYPPGGYCFDIECGDPVMNDDIFSPEYNVPSRVKDFADKMVELATYYRTNNLLIPMGGDFHYQAAEKNFINTDKLIKAFANHETINLIYSTPSCYIKAVNDVATEYQVNFVQKTDDFFPYGSDPHCYWTGYFSSRPNAKKFERLANNVLQAAKQLISFAKVNGDDLDNSVIPLRQAVGILQHHDAITGTAKQHVADDYARLLTQGIKRVEPNLATIVTDLLKKDPASTLTLDLQSCLKANVSVCDVSSATRFVVTVYNPLERPNTEYIRIPVPGGSYRVTGPDGEEQVDVVDSISGFEYLAGYDISNPKELVIAARNVAPLGIKLYYVEKLAENLLRKKAKPVVRFGTETTGFEIDENSGLLNSVTINGKTLAISQELRYYEGQPGDNSQVDLRASGAYIFRPVQPQSLPLSSSISYTTFTGNVVDEVRQVFNDWATQIIRVYKGDNNNYIEFDWLVGPIPVDEASLVGKEVISKFTVNDLNNNEVFYTDSNGREVLRRQLNKRNDYEYDPTNEPIASNYYPVTSKIVIKDESQDLEVAVLNDRAQGGSSLANGELELMVHRRLLTDDGKGVGEALNEVEYEQGVVARGQHYLVAGSITANADGKTTAAQERTLALRKLLLPIVLVSDATNLPLEDLQAELNLEWSGLKGSLPENVHILTLESWKDNTYILRLEHILENNEDPNLAQPATVNLEGLFTLFDITEIRETTLGANQWLDEYENEAKYSWNLEGKGHTVYKKHSKDLVADLNITLQPMQIRTFIIAVNKI